MASEDLTNMRSVPIWRARDTPIRSMYRLYEAMAAGEYYAIGPEVEYIWYQRSWIISRVPDPRDPDPVRYAILASIAEELAKAFNWLLSLGCGVINASTSTVKLLRTCLLHIRRKLHRLGPNASFQLMLN
ncbi:hypothetical protein BDV41DRAFT_350276 [Aspergillus transmontanensis]|uniref:Uncharacterized protein n=1 Tax=Aspergillus transmontanensis TaxID=1034304 RepID=A0A5N6VVQ2_9EURO|nr:hypothetical protein BDV41DRAFT_350276 [Aspergillus transmontanensis]